MYKIESICNSCMYVCCYAALAFSLGSGSVTKQRPNNEVMRSFVGSVARQRHVGNNGVRSEGPLPRKNLLLIQG
jgi:hypothetical protein